ncbi:MAG: glycosyltransferase [Aliifodinibius sp.]|nr:glycosyltransferase family 4 protein [Fodinibius sp.]NIY27240.1 glycosyltransferase [Fodinibius sp.]
MRYTWSTQGPGSKLSGDYGGSSHGRLTFITDRLRCAGKIIKNDYKTADIVYCLDGYTQNPGNVITAGQLVSLPSKEIGEGFYQNEVRMARRAESICDLLICNSSLHADAVIASGVAREKVTVVQPGACVVKILDRDRNRRPERPKTIGYAGLNRKNKRPWLAAYASTMVRTKFVKATCCHHREMQSFYDSVGLLVFPSVGDSWGLVASEAIARGVPVVCTDRVGAAEEVKKSGAGIVVEGLDENDFLDACVEAWYRLDELSEAAWSYYPRKPEEWADDVINLCEEWRGEKRF